MRFSINAVGVTVALIVIIMRLMGEMSFPPEWLIIPVVYVLVMVLDAIAWDYLHTFGTPFDENDQRRNSWTD